MTNGLVRKPNSELLSHVATQKCKVSIAGVGVFFAGSAQNINTLHRLLSCLYLRCRLSAVDPRACRWYTTLVIGVFLYRATAATLDGRMLRTATRNGARANVRNRAALSRTLSASVPFLGHRRPGRCPRIAGWRRKVNDKTFIGKGGHARHAVF